MIGLAGPEQAARSAAAIAAAAADEVDRDGRFPAEAVEAFRSGGLLGLMVPGHLGGPGHELDALTRVCRILGQACGSSALIYAMHQIQVACLIAGATNSQWQQDLLRRIAGEQLLLASVTSEVGVGGNIRRSLCAPVTSGARTTLTKHSSAISYGRHADAYLVTARRHQDAGHSDQVLIVAERADVALVETGQWDTLGMRGTDSRAFDIKLSVDPRQIIDVPFADLAQHVMLPVSHILWGATWLGIATDAAERSRAYLRKRLKADPGTHSPGSIRLAKVASLLATMRARLDGATAEFAAIRHDDREALPLGFLNEVNALKVTMSESALEIALEAMLICGIEGYRNGTSFSVGRHLRDLQSAPLMVSNDRIVSANAPLLVAQRSPMMRG